MELTNKELELIALHRVAPTYRKRIVATAGIAAALLLAVGIPSDGHIWGIAVNMAILMAWLLFAGWQTKRIDRAKQSQLKEINDDISRNNEFEIF